MANYRIEIRLPDGSRARMETGGLGEALDQAHGMVKNGCTVNIYDITGAEAVLVKSDAQLQAEKP